MWRLEGRRSEQVRRELLHECKTAAGQYILMANRNWRVRYTDTDQRWYPPGQCDAVRYYRLRRSRLIVWTVLLAPVCDKQTQRSDNRRNER